MNSPIQEPDFDGFDFPEKNNKIDTTEENETGLPILGSFINYHLIYINNQKKKIFFSNLKFENY